MAKRFHMTVSIKDVARAAGVSVATVSRALADGPVSEALKAKVAAAIAATGYRPNLSARRLRSQHSDTIGLIVSDIRNPFFTAVSRAVEDVAYQAGMRVILCNTDENPDKEAMYLRLMQEERVTGVIFAATRATAETLDAQALGFPVVLVDRAAPGGAADAWCWTMPPPPVCWWTICASRAMSASAGCSATPAAPVPSATLVSPRR